MRVRVEWVKAELVRRVRNGLREVVKKAPQRFREIKKEKEKEKKAS